jgi:uncharacterized protein YifN (PemK superfamily)
VGKTALLDKPKVSGETITKTRFLGYRVMTVVPVCTRNEISRFNTKYTHQIQIRKHADVFSRVPSRVSSTYGYMIVSQSRLGPQGKTGERSETMRTRCPKGRK